MNPPPIEPYRIKVVERVDPTTPEQRRRILRDAKYNLFRVASSHVSVDLLTDSGTSAMSDAQWSALMLGDEAYAGSRSFARFEAAVRELFGFPEVIPTHQGRGAEHILFSLLVKRGQVVPNNCHFDTTRANLEMVGGVGIDCVVECAYVPSQECDFKGNVDLDKLAKVLDAGNVPFGMATITNNSGGGQPVSLKNLRAVSAALHARGLPFILDACRFAENAWFIRERECPGRPIREIVREMFSLADGCTMSAKKDGLANIGGFFACRSADLAEKFRQVLVLYEGFPTYGGLAGRDLDAIAVGLGEAVEPSYLEHRVGQVRHLADLLDAAGVPVVKPAGGHAVYVDAREFLPHVKQEEFPGQALVCELYLEGGVRACEIGTLMFGKPGSLPRLDLVRLAIPRRVYTASHLGYVAECLARIWKRRGSIRGLRIAKAPEFLRHFTAELEPLPAPEGVPA